MKTEDSVSFSSVMLKKITGVDELTNDQKKAIKEIDHFLGDGNEHIFTLAGYAGTGKTTMASLIAVIAQKKHKIKDILFCASTNKALQVLAGKVYNSSKYAFSTAYSFLYETRYRKHLYESSVKRKSDINYGLIICDESSMIGANMLDDMSEFISKNNNKIIYIGDSFQLPAVKDNSYTVFDFRNQYTMTDVCRQEKDSDILAYANELRTGKKISAPSYKYNDHNDINVVDEFDLLNKYLDDIDNGRNSTCIVFKNRTRTDINYTIRERLGCKGTKPVAGETLISIANSEKAYNNGETFTIDGDYRYISSGMVSYYPDSSNSHIAVRTEAYLYYKKGKNKSLSVPLLVLPEFPSPSVYHYQFVPNDILKLFGKERVLDSAHFLDREELKKGKKRLVTYSLKQSVVIATYGYAITAHKAQGSQWDSVYILERQKTLNPENDARWLYTATTRASKELCINKDIF